MGDAAVIEGEFAGFLDHLIQFGKYRLLLFFFQQRIVRGFGAAHIIQEVRPKYNGRSYSNRIRIVFLM